MSEAKVFADVNRVKQAGKGYYMHVIVGGKSIWTRINKETHDTVKDLLKERNSKGKNEKPAA